jgi:hypothetical protein
VLDDKAAGLTAEEVAVVAFLERRLETGGKVVKGAR